MPDTDAKGVYSIMFYYFPMHPESKAISSFQRLLVKLTVKATKISGVPFILNPWRFLC